MMIQKSILASVTTLASKRQVRVVCSTGSVDRAGDIVEQAGINLAAYKANPVVLFSHDPTRPIARAVEVALTGGKLVALVQFPDSGISNDSDRVLGLVGAGVISAVSIGFNPIKGEPIDKTKPRGPQRYTEIELMELSFVSIPANTGAEVIERSHQKDGRTISADTDAKLNIIDQEISQAALHANNARQQIANLRVKANAAGQDQEEAEAKAHRQRMVAAFRLKHPPGEIARLYRLAEAERFRKSPTGMSREDRMAAADKLRH